jgi:bacterioferritin
MDKVSEIVAELQIAYATEIEIIENYLANAANLEAARADAVKNLFDEEVRTALAHARRLGRRIRALDGRVPRSPELPRLHTDSRPVNTNTTDIVLQDAIKAEDAAIARYERILRLCDGRDFVTSDLVIELLVDERERRQCLVALWQGAEMDSVPGH